MAELICWFGVDRGQRPVVEVDGDVSLVIMLDLETEVEMKLPGRFKVSPQIAGAIKAVSGVVDVQTL
jgi:DNA polymerase-3 subunit alpha